MEVWIIGAGIAALITAIVVLSIRAARARREAIRGIASGAGWQFQEEADAPDQLVALPPFDRGYGHKRVNILTGERNGEPSTVFDLHYTTGAGKSRQHHALTVAAVPLPDTLPRFTVFPERLGDRIAAVFGGQDIDFPERPDFSKAYRLRADDESATRRLFTSTIQDYLLANPRLCVACDGRELFVWREYRRVDPPELGDHIDTALGARRLLTRSE
jgi:hypothetical protein